jgi:hypothetical protein
MHDIIYLRLAEFCVGTGHVCYMNAQDSNGLSNLSASPEPTAPHPKTGTISWNMAWIDEFVDDFCGATKGGDCHDTSAIMYIGPLPPFMFFDKPKSTVICNTSDSSLCSVVHSSTQVHGVQAGQYFSRIISYYFSHMACLSMSSEPSMGVAIGLTSAIGRF